MRFWLINLLMSLTMLLFFTGCGSATDEEAGTTVNSGPLITAFGSTTNYPVTMGDIIATINATNAVKSIERVAVTVNITHPCNITLDIYLVSPSGTKVELSIGNGSYPCDENYIDTVFEDSFTTPIADGTAPYTGDFKPDGSLSVLNGQDANGIWSLLVQDGHVEDDGTINAWSIVIE